MTVGDLKQELDSLIAGMQDGEDVEVFIVDDYGGMRGIGEVRLDHWPRGHEDEPLVPGIQLLTPGWADPSDRIDLASGPGGAG